MNKKNSFKGEVTIRKSQYRDISIKGAIAHTMPTKPQEALSLMKEEIQREISSQIMFIPFPQIRNVIVSFMRPYPKSQTDYSQILSTEYSSNKQLQQLDRSINEKIQNACHQKIKLQSILKCFEKAQSLKTKVTDLKAGIRNGRDEDLRQTIKDIQLEAQKKKYQLKNGRQEQYRQIQTQRNQAILQLFEKNSKNQEKRNHLFIDLDFTYSQIKEFCKEMQKIVPIVWRSEAIPDVEEEEIGSDNFIEYFRKTIKTEKDDLLKLIHNSQAWLQTFRNDVKSHSWALIEDELAFKAHLNELKHFIDLFKENQQNIKLKVYQKLKEISKLDQHIVKNLQGQIRNNQNSYEKFVETYTDIKEVCNSKNKLKDFYRIISDEEKRLSDHMKLNCGLIVTYKPTEEFENFTNSMSKRTYVEQIFRERVTPIINAIRFINQEHNQMYKRACQDQRSGSKLRKDQVVSKLQRFKKDLGILQDKFRDHDEESNNFEYMTHLIVSLNRLMGLCKK